MIRIVRRLKEGRCRTQEVVASSKYQNSIVSKTGNECTAPEKGEENKNKSKGDSGNIQQLSTKDFHKIIVKKEKKKD